MPIKDILVHVDESLACDNRLRIAAALAVRFDARLNGIGLAETMADKRFHVHLRRSGLAGEWHTGIGLPESLHDGHELMTSDATVLSVNPEDGTERGVYDLVEHIARRGIEVRAEALSADDLSISEMLLSRAADIGADLIVMGAYGHYAPARDDPGRGDARCPPAHDRPGVDGPLIPERAA